MRVSFKAKAEPVGDRLLVKVPKIEPRHTDRAEWRASKAFGGFANSDLFPGLLRRQVRNIIGDRSCLWLDQLPAGVEADTSAFLATITITIKEP